MVFETLIRQFQRSALSVKISWINNKRSLELSPSLTKSDLADFGKKKRIKRFINNKNKDFYTQALMQSADGD